ncbi:Chibby family [Paraphysoderma sedebokerense]|nr:Chibby family [Paraphysoderma sedebokerense]KAI9138211.1 Chibby family [Paraphysoderma sedebokerense]
MVSNGWQTVKKHSRRLSESLRRSPIKEPRQTNFDDYTQPITVNLDGNELIYENNLWSAASIDGNHLKNQINALTEANQTLQEENQFLKFKIGILLDMLSVTKLDLLRLQDEHKNSPK